MSKTEIETRLRDIVSELLECGPAEVDADRKFTDYGLSSIEAIAILGDLEDWLDLDLPTNTLWDYPSLDRLAGYLVELTA